MAWGEEDGQSGELQKNLGQRVAYESLFQASNQGAASMVGKSPGRVSQASVLLHDLGQLTSLNTSCLICKRGLLNKGVELGCRIFRAQDSQHS